MNSPVATSLPRSLAARDSAASGGGKMNGKRKKPTATPKAVPNTAPSRNIVSRRNMGNPPASELAIRGGRGEAPGPKRPSVQPQFTFDEAELGRSDQPPMCHANAKQPPVEIGAPEVEKIRELRKAGGEIVILPEIALQKLWMV